MGIDTRGTVYQLFYERWVKVRTVLEGEEAIKEAGSTFLPALSGQDPKSYANYLNRGSFYNATSRTVVGLHGAIMRRPAIVKAPARLKPFLLRMTSDGQSLNSVVSTVVDELLGPGFYGIYVDVSTDLQGTPRPYLSLYDCLSIYRCTTRMVGDQEKIDLLVLKEEKEEKVAGDSYETEIVEYFKEIFLDDDNLVVVRQYKMGESEGENKGKWVPVPFDEEGTLELRPTKAGGKRLDEIPFVFFGATRNSPIPSKPPLMDLVNLNIKHWQVSTDYWHGIHVCALPTPYAIGFPTETQFHLGPEKCLVTDNPSGSCGYMEFTGQGMRAVLDSLQELKKDMAVVGARLLLETPKAGVEAAETVRLHSSADTATLTSIANNTEEGFKKVLQFACMYINEANAEIDFDVNRDFISAKMSAQDLIALVQAVQSGEISRDTFIYNLKMGELLPPDRTIEEEKALIEEDATKRLEEGMERFKEQQELVSGLGRKDEDEVEEV